MQALGFWMVVMAAALTEAATPVQSKVAFCEAVEIHDARVPVRTQGSGTIRLASTPSIEIGSIGGEGGTDFSAIASVAFLSNRLLAVSDEAWRDVRIFDLETGGLQSTLGRKGEGPGEFAAAPAIAASPAGGVWAWDPLNRRLYEFAVDGPLRSSRSLSSEQLAVAAMNPLAVGWIVTPAGATISVASKWWSAVIDEQQIVILDGGGTDPVVLGPTTQRRVEVDRPYVLPNPFRALRQAAPWVSGIAVSSPDERWEVAEYSLDGALIRQIRLPLQGPEVHGEIFDAQRKYYQTRHPNEPQLVQLLDSFKSVGRTSAIGGILSDGDGTLWVRRWRSQDPVAPDCFDIIEAGGSPIAAVAVPADHGRVIAVSESRVVSVWLDGYDVPHLRVYPLVKDLRD